VPRLTTGKEFAKKEPGRRPSPDHSEVAIFPPVIPLTAFLLGVVMEWLVPLSAWPPAPMRTTLRVVGAIVFGVGMAGFVWMIRTMKRERTPIHNSRTPTTLVETGPFRFTRNPMYVFGSIWYAGLSLLLLQVWSLALLPVVVIATHFGVVLREESFLEQHFGDVYRRYKAHVPRYW
jgi:protein-S-isoprenylcysteine O-methyltransferase Ste14